MPRLGGELGQYALGEFMLGDTYDIPTDHITVYMYPREITLYVGGGGVRVILLLKKGEKGTIKGITVLKSDGSAYDLTGKTCTLKMWISGSAAAAITAACTVIDASAGTMQFTTESTSMTKNEGLFEAEVEFVESTTVVDNTKPFTIWVRESL